MMMNGNHSTELAMMEQMLYCPGLTPHNNSVDMLVETIKRHDAVIDIGGESRRYSNSGSTSFAIRVKGLSGTQYRVSVYYLPRYAEVVAKRIEQIDLDDPEQIAVLMRPFGALLHFESHWHDARDGDWNHLCIHERRDRASTCWPGDALVSIIEALVNDLRSALEPEMNTLRHELLRAYPVAFCNHQTPPETTYSDVSTYCTVVAEINKCKKKKDTTEKCKLAREQFFGDGSHDS